MTRLALFDLDGTLVDSVDDLATSVNHALARVGLPARDREEIRGFIGDGARMLLSRAVGARLDLLEPALAAWRAHYEDHLLDRTRPYPGVPEVLAGAGRPLAVLTNKPAPMARRILDGLGLAPRFAAIVGGGDAPAKPDPAGARALLARAGVRPEDAVLVGDSPVDAQTARNAGMEFVAVTWGLVPREELVRAGAIHLVDRAEELAPWLR
ncbi:MAG TPA: HAD-IA family hydrolase [Anaeromyxobacter sp.]|nr:HAD-IA family hydrolase [Anaeromyxobacter sp.]